MYQIYLFYISCLFTPGIFEELDPELLLDLSLLAPVRKVAGFPWHV